MREITELRDFQAQLDSGTPFIIWFGATWCGPCRAIDATAVAAAATKANVTLFHCDIDNGKRIANVCGIRSIPTFMTFVGGEPGKKLATPNTTAICGFVEKFAEDTSR